MDTLLEQEHSVDIMNYLVIVYNYKPGFRRLLREQSYINNNIKWLYE